MRERDVQLLREMLRIRRFEEKAAELYTVGKVHGFLHLYNGEEAVAVGALRGDGALDADDNIVSSYRDHGHALARGVPMRALMAELLGKATGCSRGRGGSMHFFDAPRRFWGGLAIVGEGLPIAVGLALADKMRGRRGLTVCFFGDGAAAEGAFHESLNLASLWRLPVLFLLENNRYAMGTALERHQAQVDLGRHGPTHGMASDSCDGMDVLAVEAAVARAAARVRAGEGPLLLEAHTYRYRAHSMYDPELYRTRAEVEAWKQRDPIARLARGLAAAGLLDERARAALEASIAAEVDDAVGFAEASPWEPVEEMTRDVTTPRPPGGAA